MPPSTLKLRKGIAGLADLADSDLASVWREVAIPIEARDALRDTLPGLLDSYGLAAGSLAADWYDDLRDARNIRGRFTAIVADLGDLGGDALAGWGVSPLFQAEPDWDAAKTQVAGGLQRRIANVARQTVSGSSIQDPSARGWLRVGDGGCEFCQMLIGRGSVYSEASADFESHDHCHCAAEPAWR